MNVAPPRQTSGGDSLYKRRLCERRLTFEDLTVQGRLTFGDPFQESGVAGPYDYQEIRAGRVPARWTHRKLGRCQLEENQNLYQNRLVGPVTYHVLVQEFSISENVSAEIGQVFPQPL